jgi:hypothetical protein
MSIPMKKLVLSIALLAFAVAVQADDASFTSKTHGAKVTAQTKTTCAAKTQAGCSSCCKEKKQAVLSPKAAAEKGS